MAYGIGVYRYQLLTPASYYPTISRPRALELVTSLYDKGTELTMVDRRDWSRLIRVSFRGGAGGHSPPP